MGKEIYSEEHRKIVEKLRQIREEKSLKQSDVAALLGRSQSYISKIESGQLRISVIQLKEFARIYRTNIECLIS